MIRPKMKIRGIIKIKSIHVFVGIVFFASYYRQLYADIRMYNYKIKTSLISPEMPN